jgi:putative transcriptional regulator
MKRLVAASISVLLASSALGQQPLAPAKGMFLVAKDEIEGGPFHQSVVLLLAHGDEGTLGLIVNRTTEIPLKKALPEIAGDSSHELYFGGPVALSGLMYLFRSAEAPEGADHVMDDVYYSGDAELLEKLLKAGKERDELLAFLGHAGWASGQLDGELVRGSWDVVRADAFAVFGKDPATLWHELSKDSRVIARSSRPSRPSSRSAPDEARSYLRAGSRRRR